MVPELCKRKEKVGGVTPPECWISGGYGSPLRGARLKGSPRGGRHQPLLSESPTVFVHITFSDVLPALLAPAGRYCWRSCSYYPPAPPGEKGRVPLPLLRSYPLCRRFATPRLAKAAGPFRARGGTLLPAQVLSGRRRSQLSDGTGPRACTPTWSTQTAGYRHPTSRVFLNDFYYLQNVGSW
jgi:hypothetical protein